MVGGIGNHQCSYLPPAPALTMHPIYIIVSDPSSHSYVNMTVFLSLGNRYTMSFRLEPRHSVAESWILYPVLQVAGNRRYMR